MRVEVTFAEQSFRYRVTPEAGDREAVPLRNPFGAQPRDLALRGGEYEVKLPACFTHIHPDLHGAAVLMALRPFIGTSLALPFAVSAELARAVEELHGIGFAAVDPTLRPRACPPRARPSLLFSGGMDSTAASLLLPPETVHLFLDRVPHPELAADGDVLVELEHARALGRLLGEDGREVVALGDGHEVLFRPYPQWHSDASVLAPLYLADSLGLDTVEAAHVLCVAHFGGYLEGAATGWSFRPFAPPQGEARRSEDPLLLGEGGLLGLRLAASTIGLSEVATAKVVARSRYAGKTASCYYRGPSYCMRCDKCFKKLLLAHIALGQRVPAALFDHFLQIDHLRAIFDRPFFDWHHIWYYVFQKIECDHPFVAALQEQARLGPDLALLEKWYPRHRALIPAAYRDAVEEKLDRSVGVMSEAEVRALEGLSVPPLHAPPRAAPIAAARGGTPAGPRLETPSHVALNVTRRCQQRCYFCFEGERAGKRELTREEALALIDEAARKVEMIVFMGAEALLRRDVLDLFRHAAARGLRVSVFTNGQKLAEPGLVAACVAAGLSEIQLSLNCWDEASFVRATRTKAARWAYVLRALANIDAQLAAPPAGAAPLVLNLNVIAHGGLADHLLDVLRLAGRQLPHWRPSVTFRQLLRYGEAGAAAAAASAAARIPLARLRAELERLGELGLEFSDLSFQGFPLCALPGMEHLSSDLRRAARHYDLLFNFADQSSIREMPSLELPPALDVYGHVCRGCTLRDICPGTFLGSQFPDYAPTAEQAPIPSAVDPREVLRRVGLDAGQAEDFIAARRRDEAAPPPAAAPGAPPAAAPGAPPATAPPDDEPGWVTAAGGPHGWLWSGLRRLASRPRLRGFEVRAVKVVAVEPGSRRALKVALARGPERLVVGLHRAVPGEDYFVSVPGFGLRYDGELPLDSATKRAVARLVLEAYARLAREGRPREPG
ncbi:MAG TPA: DUF6395 domain-containing protein [Polyangia bacterium]|jgi:hypothetical protein